MKKEFLNIAKGLKPKLIETKVFSTGNFLKPLKENESIIVDFHNHYVGFVTLNLCSFGSHQDAPALIKIKFCEVESEIDEDTSNYRGWISKGWLQEEIIHVDVLPAKITLKRRYAFRFVKIEVLATSQKYSLVVNSVTAKTFTSASRTIEPIGTTDFFKRIDEVSLRTLSECMQYEFEDGPKRDQRLWLGDLRLQALTNYETYRNNDLVKRCLYLFAGTKNYEGRLSGCIFTKPKVEADDVYMFDYSLLFIPTLLDYLIATNDLKTGEDLFPIALRQFELSLDNFKNDIIVDSEKLGWCFLDWNLELNKQAGAQAIFIYCAKELVKICKLLGKDNNIVEDEIDRKSKSALNTFFDNDLGLFVSGKDKQVSYASNVWFILAGLVDKKQSREILNKLKTTKNCIMPVTPYMYHHYVQALVNADLYDEALDFIKRYWGAMVDDGADTFYELFNPSNPNESPYGSRAMNSYCHAWSCTPSYFFRKYFFNGGTSNEN